MALLAVVALVPAIAGARGVVPPGLGVASGALSVAALLLAGALGLKGLRLAASARDKEAERIALVIVAGMLRDKSSEELEPLTRQEGPAGDAARMILARRREDQERAALRQPPAR
ncbi:MAG TPA: hypothetical protein VFI39_05840 [Gemmatimonadales bacterium]|nr:hypothetical protein [Gemmatimonadales bacterium]